MKKVLLFAVAACFSLASFAQDGGPEGPVGKKGQSILPAAGDWMLGLDATPYLNYAGNLFNSGNTSPSSAFVNGYQTIFGKYMITDMTAWRGQARIGFNNYSESADDLDSSNTALNITLGFGKEWRKGNRRLQGIYGAEALLNIASNSAKSTIQDIETEQTSGLGLGVGVRGFVGAEYFIFPKLSVGAEFGWGLMFMSQGEGETTVDGNTISKTASSNTISVDTDNANGVLKLLLYF